MNIKKLMREYEKNYDYYVDVMKYNEHFKSKIDPRLPHDLTDMLKDSQWFHDWMISKEIYQNIEDGLPEITMNLSKDEKQIILVFQDVVRYDKRIKLRETYVAYMDVLLNCFIDAKDEWLEFVALFASGTKMFVRFKCVEFQISK